MQLEITIVGWGGGVSDLTHVKDPVSLGFASLQLYFTFPSC